MKTLAYSAAIAVAIALFPTPGHAWFIWGRRGESAHVSEAAISWPANLAEPADTLTTRNWGTILLTPGAKKPKKGTSVAFTSSTTPGIADGMVAEDEWDLAKADLVKTIAGPMMVTGQVCGEELNVAVVMPAVPTISERTQVLLMLSPTKTAAQGVPDGATAFELGYDARRDSTKVRTARGEAGKWKWGFDEIGPSRAGLSMHGDDSWKFLVAEYSIPFSVIGAKVGETKTMAMAVIVRGLPKHQESRDMIYWPAGHAPYTPINTNIVCAHPDGWAVFRPGTRRVHMDETLLPTVKKAPVLDGKVGESEWKGGASFSEDFLGIGHVKYHAEICGGNLWLAAVCDTPRLHIGKPMVQILMDPDGDGGLLPRPDDVLVEPGVKGKSGKICWWKLPPAAARSGTVNFVGKWTERQVSPGSRVVFTINNDVLSMEAVVSLKDVGMDLQKLPPTFGMMIRIGYTSEYTVGEKK